MKANANLRRSKIMNYLKFYRSIDNKNTVPKKISTMMEFCKDNEGLFPNNVHDKVLPEFIKIFTSDDFDNFIAFLVSTRSNLECIFLNEDPIYSGATVLDFIYLIGRISELAYTSDTINTKTLLADFTSNDTMYFIKTKIDPLITHFPINVFTAKKHIKRHLLKTNGLEKYTHAQHIPTLFLLSLIDFFSSDDDLMLNRYIPIVEKYVEKTNIVGIAERYFLSVQLDANEHIPIWLKFFHVIGNSPELKLAYTTANINPIPVGKEKILRKFVVAVSAGKNNSIQWIFEFEPFLSLIETLTLVQEE